MASQRHLIGVAVQGFSCRALRVGLLAPSAVRLALFDCRSVPGLAQSERIRAVTRICPSEERIRVGSRTDARIEELGFWDLIDTLRHEWAFLSG